MAAGGINLAPGSQYVLQSRRQQRRMVLVSVLIIIALAAVWGGMSAYQQQLSQEQENLTAQLRNIRLEIAKLEGESGRITSFENRLTALDQLLDNHLEWSGFFADLERLLPPDVVLLALDTDSESGTIGISAETTNIDRVAVALATLSASSNPNSIFSGGSINSITPREETNPDTEEVTRRVAFDAELTFDLDRIHPER